MSYLLVFFTISLIITLHELGHLLAAKRMGIPIARFSVGFGRKLWGFKIGKTEYWLSLFPCGGYVLPALEDEEAFAKIPLKSRIVFSLVIRRNSGTIRQKASATPSKEALIKDRSA